MSGAEFETGLHYPIKLSELPATWSFGYVEEFSKLIESGFACGAHNQTGAGVQHLRPMNITSKGVIDLGDARHVPADFNPKRLQEGNVLFNNTNSPALVGKTAHVGPSSSGKAYSNHMTRVVFGEPVDSQFAARQLNFLFTVGYFLHRCVKHVNQASISSRELGRTVPLVVPPLAEQKRIVAKIEELFSELDAGEASLRRARRQLGVYRQSLLKQAFEGKLTAPWRAQHPDLLESPDQLLARIQSERQARYQQQLKEWETAVKTWEKGGKKGKRPAKPSEPSTFDRKALKAHDDILTPSEWAAELVGNCPTDSLIGLVRSAAEQHTGPAGFSYIKMDRIDMLGNVNLSPDVFVECADDEVERFALHAGDILFNTRNSVELVGKTGIVRRDPESPTVFNNNLMRIRLPDCLDPVFVGFQLCSQPFRQRMEKAKKATTSVAAIYAKDFWPLPLVVCSLPEQQEIVRLLDAQFSVIEQTEREIDAALKRSEALRQSILKKAFTGQLVPQDPTDEPVSALLSRIRMEREAVAESPRKAYATKRTI